MTRKREWAQRLKVTSNVVHVGGFVLGTAATIIAGPVDASASIAILLVAVGVAVAVVVDVPFAGTQRRGLALLAFSVVLYSIAIALTDGTASGFVVMPVGSIFLAAIGGGAAAAVPVAAVSIGGLFAALWSTESSVSIEAYIRLPTIYVITAIAFSEVQRALLSEVERAEDLSLARETAEGRRARLEETHELLEDLLRVANAPEVNAVASAQNALRDIGVVLPMADCRIVGKGNVTLAHRGGSHESEPAEVFVIGTASGELARLDLWMDEGPLSPSQRAAIEASIVPVGLAIENDEMVQQLAGLTIQRERVRLARELHDDIAPSIASVGLTLDMLLMGDHLNEEDQRTLEATRSNVTRLVDVVRARVQDLRADRTTSLVERAHSLVAEVDADGPTVVVDIEERVPPRPAVAAELSGLLTEAFRNAVEHAGATVIEVTGRVGVEGGTIAVTDNGRGFDPSSATDDRYGLVGMKERAQLIGAEFDVTSAPGRGTTVSVSWSGTS